MAASRPNCVSVKPRLVLMGMPSTANIIQTAKQMVNAKVLLISTDACLRRMPGSTALLLLLFLVPSRVATMFLHECTGRLASRPDQLTWQRGKALSATG
ncbi:hypothetical protein D3C81_1691590 [compost metagenome]